MSAARRGAVAATVLLAGFVALLLSPVSLRADTTTSTTSTGSLSTQVVDANSTSSATRSVTVTTTTICTNQLVPPPPRTVCNTYTISGSSTVSGSSSTTTETTAASTLTYAVLPGSVTTIPPTATPKPSPTPSPSPSETTDTGITALGTDTQSATAEPTRATTVVNAQPGGDSSSVLPLTVLAFLVIIGGGAIFLITRLR